MRRGAFLCVVWLGCLAAGARADQAPPQPDGVPVARPVVPVDDTRSHGPTARDWFDLSAMPQALLAPQTVWALVGQVAIGPPTLDVREVRELYDQYALSNYQLRVRGGAYRSKDQGTLGGPITVAGQRYFPVAPLAISPLLYAHFGVEAALSTPWVSSVPLSE